VNAGGGCLVFEVHKRRPGGWLRWWSGGEIGNGRSGGVTYSGRVVVRVRYIMAIFYLLLSVPKALTLLKLY
jgi:hypothetical protein